MLLLVLLFFNVSLNVFSDLKEIKISSMEIGQYEKIEINILIDINDIYNQEVELIFDAPSGKNKILPCYREGYIDGKAVWKARFAAQEAGTYKVYARLIEFGKIIEKSKSYKFEVKSTNKKGFLHTHNNWFFKYDNGELFRGIGINFGWESRDDDDSRYFKTLHENPKYNYYYVLSKLKENGANFFRTWMVYWNLPVDWKNVENNSRYTATTERFNLSAAKRMDELVELCDLLGMHMMLTLESHVSFIGHGWDINPYNVKNGGFAKTPYDFFTNSKAKEMYKQKLRYLVARWGYSPSIAVWEFFNEIDNAMYNVPDSMKLPSDIIVDWHKEMSAYLKQIDPYNHIVSTSISHRDVMDLNDVNTLDFNQRHIYKNTESIPLTIVNYSNIHKKPYVIGEYSYEWDWSKNFDEFQDSMIYDFKRGLLYGLFSPTPILPMSWWWEWFENKGMFSYFKKLNMLYQIMMNTNDADSFHIVTPIHITNGRSYILSTGSVLYVYFEKNQPKNDFQLEVNNIDYPTVYFYDEENETLTLYKNYSKINDSLKIIMKANEHNNGILIIMNDLSSRRLSLQGRRD